MSRLSRLSRLFGVALLAAVSAVAVAAPPAAAAGVTTGPVFNNPTGTAAQKAAIVTRVVQLIDGAAAGSQIRMAMFYADDPTIPTALINADQRGVGVQVVFSNKQATQPVYATLADALGTDTTAASYVTLCPAGRGCIGNRPLGSVASINHNKFYLFSNTLGTANVVVQSSANLHTGRDGNGGWNNALVLAGNTGIYNAYHGYFDDLVAKKVNNNYYTTGRAPVTSGAAKIHFFPRQETSGASPYSDPATDTISTVLDHIACFGNTSTGTADNHRTIIRVNQHILSRTYLAAKLVALDAAGCYVEVVQNYNPASNSEVTSLTSLLKKTSSAYNGVVVRYWCASDSVWTHSKYLMVEGKYYGAPDRKIVWTGSANFSYNSLRQSDETILQVEDPGVFDGYLANFRAARDSAAHQPANGASITC